MCTWQFAERLTGKNVMFAFVLSAGHRESDRIVSIDLKKITIGQIKDAPSNAGLVDRVFRSTGYRVAYEPNMEDYLLSHAAFVLPGAFACYYSDEDLKKCREDIAHLYKMINANIEGYRAIIVAGHAILPDQEMTSRVLPTARPAFVFQANVRHQPWENLRSKSCYERDQ